MLKLPKLSPKTLRVLIAVVAAALAALAGWWLWRRPCRREGWEFEGRETEVTDPDHITQIKRWCYSGRKPGEMRDTDDFGHMRKYSHKALNTVCKNPRLDWMKRVASGAAEEGGVQAKRCPGGRTCQNASVRVTHPCANIKGDKCCMYEGDWNSDKFLQNCVLAGAGTKPKAIDNAKMRRENEPARGDRVVWVDNAGKNYRNQRAGTTKKAARVWDCVKYGKAHLQIADWTPAVSDFKAQKQVTAACNKNSKCGGGGCVAVRTFKFNDQK